ncbi:hypothetical protein [Burkholderia ubonensis]|uniref:hypothetical protein n=1 Tax=Burkholderia ubonensis TaxID=101571 RepID=UPI000AC41A0D|nr:hypothetical protein [Burkholderia ubonensis]
MGYDRRMTVRESILTQIEMINFRMEILKFLCGLPLTHGRTCPGTAEITSRQGFAPAFRAMRIIDREIA